MRMNRCEKGACSREKARRAVLNGYAAMENSASLDALFVLSTLSRSLSLFLKFSAYPLANDQRSTRSTATAQATPAREVGREEEGGRRIVCLWLTKSLRRKEKLPQAKEGEKSERNENANEEVKDLGLENLQKWEIAVRCALFKEESVQR